MLHRCTALLLALFTTIAGARAVDAAPWVSGYYAAWRQDTLPAAEIDFTAITHLIHFGLVPYTDGTLDDAANQLDLAHSQEAVTQAHLAGKPVLVSVAGPGSLFRQAAGDAHRAAFVDALKTFVTDRGYDGVDIDWEPLNTGDAAIYQALVLDLREALNTLSPGMLLTTALVPVDSTPAIVRPVAEELDQINLMTYDMSNAWPDWVTWHNSALYNGGHTFPCCNEIFVPSIHESVLAFTGGGIPAEKLGMGIEFYSYAWRGGAGTDTGGVTKPLQTWTTAPTVLGNVNRGQFLANYYRPEYEQWDDEAFAAYLSIDQTGSANDRFVSYENGRSMQAKLDYLTVQQLGGVIIWELAGGYVPAAAAGQKDELLQTFKRTLPPPDEEPNGEEAGLENGSDGGEEMFVDGGENDVPLSPNASCGCASN